MRLDLHGHTHHIRAEAAHAWYIYIHMYVFRRDTFRLKHSVSRVATAMEDDSAAEHSRKQNKIPLSHARSATEHRANEAVTTEHMQGSATAQCALVSEHTSEASSVSELHQWLSFGPQPPTRTIGIWQIQISKQWNEYDPEINTDIERQYQNGERVAHFQQRRSKKAIGGRRHHRTRSHGAMQY